MKSMRNRRKASRNHASRHLHAAGILPAEGPVALRSTPREKAGAAGEDPRIDQKSNDVMLALLSLNREEIRHWQGALFSATFWFNAAIMATAAFAYNLREVHPGLRIVIAVGIGCLCIFYFVLSEVARSAVELNGEDLLKIQHALGLYQAGAYIAGEPVYDSTGRWLPQTHIGELQKLTLFVSMLALGAVGVAPNSLLGPSAEMALLVGLCIFVVFGAIAFARRSLGALARARDRGPGGES